MLEWFSKQKKDLVRINKHLSCRITGIYKEYVAMYSFKVSKLKTLYTDQTTLPIIHSLSSAQTAYNTAKIINQHKKNNFKK